MPPKPIQNPFFKALGWDVENAEGLPKVYAI
jgi:hypothetical protein